METSRHSQLVQHISALSPDSRVWVYQSDRPFTAAEVAEVENALQAFARQWVSHNRQLRAAAGIMHDRFVILAVDESQAGASGCSIDASVHFLKQLQAALGVELFDRMRFSYRDGEQVVTVARDEFARRYAAGEITDNTPVYDTLVKTTGELQHRFEKPLHASWHSRMV